MAFAKLLSAKIRRNKKAAFKFKLTTFYERIDCEFQKGYVPNKLLIRWSRGTREVVSSNPLWVAHGEDDSAVQGKAKFEPVEAVELLVTLYKPPKSVEYEDKFYKYTIEDVGLNGKKHVLGMFELNVAEYANVSQRYELALICKTLYKKVFNISIVMMLEVEFLKSGSAMDDDMISTWSALPGNDRDYSDGDDEFPDDDSITGRTRGMSTDLASILGESVVSLISRNKQELILPEHTTGSVDEIYNSRSLALLFSANWSDTCVSFIQTMDKFYNNPSIKENKKFEVIYVSCDYDDESLLQGIKKHSIGYVCIKPKSLLAENLKEHYEVSSIPQLLLVNPETGRVIERDGKKELDKCHGSTEEQKALAALWSKGKNSQSANKLIAVKDSSVSNSLSTLDGISENSTAMTRRKGSLKQLNTEQLIAQLESRLRQKEQELRVSQDQLQAAQEEITGLISENESLQSKNFEMNDQVRQLKIIVKEFGDQNRAMADEKQQLVAAMEVKGWLFKRGITGPTGRKWRKRYFQNNGYFLSYYKSPNIDVEQGSINLKKVTNISILPEGMQDKNLASFNIITENRVYELQAKSPEEMNTWIRAVNYLSSYHKENILRSFKQDVPKPPSIFIEVNSSVPV
eukprot:TRINITY_DN10822_c1_g2_i1.p1 TRINITY_DN10822_c1_g2~~TRINITY_DN10822_c1_g2_i1.p1  ORF type:complete len:642 (+),score=167.92 TRINITY_DN10822_c1_g2_i1:37-1926(+)